MTIKGLKDLGFTIEKGSGRTFTISKGELKAKIEKVTDTKFKFGDNEATHHIEIILEQIQNSKNK